jgi:hypothetical protein
VFDLAYITGPVLAGALATGLAPAAALGLMLALTGVAVMIIGRQPRDTPADHPPERRSRPRFPLRSARLGRLLGRLLLGAHTSGAHTSPGRLPRLPRLLVCYAGGRGAQRQRHGNAGLAELDHEWRSGGRRRRNRRRAERGRRQPAHPRPRAGLCPGARRGGERRRRRGSHVSGARARPVR